MKHFSKRHFQILLASVLVCFFSTAGLAQDAKFNEPGIMEPVTSHLEGRDVRVPNTDQSIDGVVQSTVKSQSIENAFSPGVFSMTGNEITQVTSPNADMRSALRTMAHAAEARDQAAMEAAAADLRDILLGTTVGRIYDGFSMLNWNRFHPTDFGVVSAEHFAPGVDVGEYKMKTARDTGETFVSPFDGEDRKIWEVDINMLYYDGQIDSDTFLMRFPLGHHPDDVVHVNYRIFSLVQEDFSPTLAMLDRRHGQNTVNFPFKAFDSVWIGFFPGEVLNVTLKYPPVRMIRGVYTWGWRVHPPRIQFLQPVYDIVNAHTGETELDPQGYSYAFRNREDLTLDAISDIAPEMKMYNVVKAVLLDDATPQTIENWLTKTDQGPRGRWFDWANLVAEQRQLPDEVWDRLAEEEGLEFGEFGDYNMITAFMNNEMYGAGPFKDEIKTWDQGELFNVKLINLDDHTHYFRNVDFGARLHDDIQRCCGGGETSFEIMSFKPSYGAPKVAEMQWRAGWGFRPHYDVIQQQGVFSRGVDRAAVAPYKGGFDGTYFGYQYSEEARGGDFRFNPPPFVITDAENPAPFALRDSDGEPGLLIGQRTEGYGVATICGDDPYPGFCSKDIQQFNPNGVKNWPPPPLQGQGLCGDEPEPCELRWPPFLRNPCQDGEDCGDIIPPTDAWRPFLWYNPNNGTLFIDPDDPSKGHWADLTYSHGSPVFAGESLNAKIELPRASGQVFYQFDDLFHDNSIFSPHPVFTGFGEPEVVDEVVQLRAVVNFFVRVRGRLSVIPSSGKFARWVSIHEGSADGNGCTGELLGTAPVNAEDGTFVFRNSGKGSSSLGVGIGVGSALCAQSTVGGFAEAVIQ